MRHPISLRAIGWIALLLFAIAGRPLPNELFLTGQGTSFDGAGIPPTIALALLR